MVAVAPLDSYSPRLAELGARLVPLKMDTRGKNPFNDIALLFGFYSILRREKPDAFLGYTIKPNIYGSIAAKFVGIPCINNIAGLGAAFNDDAALTKFVQSLYRVSLRSSAKIFFQNNDDKNIFEQRKIISSSVSERLPGSGIDLTRFTPPERSEGPFRFLLSARMLWEKGIQEYVEAARIIKNKYPDITFQLMGFIDEGDSKGVPFTQIEAWEREGVISFLGAVEDVRVHLANAHCVVLPSYYREGVPRALLEAAAMALPIITTDSVGCCEAIDDGVTGYLCIPKDAADLACKMEKMLLLPFDERKSMGNRGREKMRNQFDETIVIDRYISALNAIGR